MSPAFANLLMLLVTLALVSCASYHHLDQNTQLADQEIVPPPADVPRNRF
jgi:hypothetical protein